MSVNLISLEHLTKDYATRRALDDVSFEVRAGEIFGFVGSNGAGKTTTMRIMLGVTTATSGRVLFDGDPITAASRATIGYMPEERGLYPKMRVHDQLVYLARLHGLSRTEADRNATHWEDALGIATYRADRVEALSLGNQQRVQLASALTHNPAALVLDEPFSGLDPLAVDAMSAALRQQADAGIPVLFSSHQLERVEKLCDRVGILSDGRLVACGSIPELRAGAVTRTRFRGDSPALRAIADAAKAAGREVVRVDSQTLLVCGDSGEDAVAHLAQAGLAAGHLTEFSPYHEPLSLMYRAVVDSSAPEPEAPEPSRPRRRWRRGDRGGRS